MPKRKEVHLKKLIKGGDDANKESEIQVRNVILTLSDARNRRHSLSFRTGIQT